MSDFRRNNRSGGERRGGFGRRDFVRGGFGDRDRMMHKAICAECGKECEVPFRPSGDRPVYCSNCFEKRGNQSGNPRPDDRNFDRPRFEQRRPQSGGGGDRGNVNAQLNGQIMEQYTSLSVKVDKIVSVLELIASQMTPSEPKIEEPKAVKAKAPKEKVTKEKIKA